MDELRLAISKLKNNLTLAIKLGNNGRNAYKYKYNWSLMGPVKLGNYGNL